MPRPQVIALALPHPLPPLPTEPAPTPSPLQNAIQHLTTATDYDAVCVPLTNTKWHQRWETLCTRPLDEQEPSEEVLAERERIDWEADLWRKEGGLNRDELVVSRLEETGSMVALASEWLEMDSPDEGIRFDSELALRAELAHALYLAVPVLVLPAPTLANRAFLPSYARAIADLLQMGGPNAFTQLSIRIPISDPTELIHQGPAQPPQANSTNGYESNSITDKRHKRISSMSTRPASIHGSSSLYGAAGSGNQLPVMPGNNRQVSTASSLVSTRSNAPIFATGDPSSTWEMWDCIRRICNYHPRLSVALDLTHPLPPSVGALARWTAEPVKNIWLPSSSFIPNAKGYPVLSKACQAFLRGMARQFPTIILSGVDQGRHQVGGANAYLQYVRHVTSTPGPVTANSASALSNSKTPEGPDYAAGYADFLQAPLQPLMDDLGSATYDVFERDPVKYTQYEEAIFLALSDLPQHEKHVVLIVGAGRGPLVACTLRAVQRAQREAKVYAVDKNISAFTTLQERKATEWHDAVDIIFGDMRTINIPEQADIMVSELLGSFGDNELSPECLDGAMRFLKPEGISIPASYTAHLAPISSTKLYTEVTAATRPAGAAETPYVVMMNAVNVISGETGGQSGRCGDRIQQCWTFEHPRRDLILDHTGTPLTNSHNSRSSTLTFHIPHAGILHGLAGYFEAHLYSNIGLSIHPDNAHRVSPDMMSWFPLFFPFKEPLYLPSGSELDVSIWRLSDGIKRKVWYEWAAQCYLPTLASNTANGSAPNSAGPSPNLAVAQQRTPGGPNSPLMDAPYTPVYPPVQHSGEAGRIKIGQTTLHNAGGNSSWVGL